MVGGHSRLHRCAPERQAPSTRSPRHRSEYFRELIADWRDDPVTDMVLTLLPEWVRWNGEQAGVPAHLIERGRGRVGRPDVTTHLARPR